VLDLSSRQGGAGNGAALVSSQAESHRGLYWSVDELNKVRTIMQRTILFVENHVRIAPALCTRKLEPSIDRR
jgi:hypothetical protein